MFTRTCICGRSHTAPTPTGLYNLIASCHGERSYPVGPRVVPRTLPLLDPSLPVAIEGPRDTAATSRRPSFIGRRYG